MLYFVTNVYFNLMIWRGQFISINWWVNIDDPWGAYSHLNIGNTLRRIQNKNSETTANTKHK